MKKVFKYEVGTHSFEDETAFGTAWKQAKEKATELHCAIYREVVQDKEIRREAYVKGGCFLNTKYVNSNNIMIF